MPLLVMDGMRRLLAMVIAALTGTALIISIGPARPSLASARSPASPPAGAAGRASAVVTAKYGSSTAPGRAAAFDDVAAPPVTALAVDQLTTSSVTLTWADPPVPDFRGVLIERSGGATAPGRFHGWHVGHVVFLPGERDIWTDRGLWPGHAYTYTVLAGEGRDYAPPASVTVTVPTHPELSGRVTDSHGHPVAGVTVNVLDAGGTEASHATTSDEGSWTVAGLGAGSYTVCFGPAGGATGAGGHGFLPQCWQDASPGGTPASVTVDPAARRTGLDARLADAGGISGAVTRAGGRPVPHAVAVIYDRNGDVADAASSGRDGTWHVSGLPPGRYTACFYPPGGKSAYAFQCYHAASPATALPITVTSGATVTGIDATLRPAASAATASAPAAARSAVAPGTTTTASLRAAVPQDASAAIASGTSTVTSSDQLPLQACADVLFLGARGSGESGPGGLNDNPSDPSDGLGGPVYTAYRSFAAHLDGRSVTAPVSVSYPADNVWTIGTPLSNAYFTDLDNGVTTALAALTARAAQCPRERVVLAGFSSGAMLMHRVLWALHDDSSSPAYASILSRLDAVILIGDGDRVADDDTTDYGSAPRGARGVGTHLFFSHTIDQPLPKDLGARTVSVCDSGDIVCDNHVPPVNAFYGLHVHLTHYTGKPNVQDAATAAARLENAVTAPMPVITTTHLPDAVVGQHYSAELTTADHRDGTWAIDGNLPDGLALNGYTISGTPTRLGPGSYTTDFTFTLRFTDDYNETVTAGADLTETAPSQGGGPGPGSSPGDLTGLPLPSNAADPSAASQVQTADCGPGTCVAAGGYADSSGNTHMALWLWDGSGWTATEAPEPAGSLGTYDYALWSSCGAQRCVVSGVDAGAGGTVPVFWSWSGGSWSVAPVPVPAGAQDASGLTILAVSCGGSGLCAAAGRYEDSGGHQQAGLWASAGGTWSVTTAPLPADAAADPQAQGYDVSCGTTTCFAYGSYDGAASAQPDAGWSLAAGSWNLAPLLPAGAAAQPDLRILSAACLAATCLAAIAYDDAQGGNDTAVAQYTSGTWGPAALPMPAGAQATATLIVDGAACGWNECLVSASYFDASFSLHRVWWTWTGGGWAAIPVPAADADSFGYLACGEGICAAEDSQMSSLWVWTAGSATVSQQPFPSGATASPGGSLACGTGQCAALGTVTGASGTSQSALLVSSGGAVSAAYDGAASYQTANPLVTLTCGAGICLANG